MSQNPSGTYSPQGLSGQRKIASQRVLVGISGRSEKADSYVVAALLKSQGHEVIGCHLRVSPLPTGWGGFRPACVQQPSVEAIEAACQKLDIPLHVIEAQDRFVAEVADPFVQELLGGQAARPCVGCNDRFRIPLLLAKAAELRCEKVATGHHAQLNKDPGSDRMRLLRSSARERDQSIDLFRLRDDQLSKLMFPLGTLSESLLSRLAGELGLSSDGASSVPVSPCPSHPSDLLPLIESRSADSLRPGGMIRSTDGQMMGEHQGIFRFRLGQTEGLGLPPAAPGSQPLAVVEIDPIELAVTIGDPTRLQTQHFSLRNFAWIRKADGLRIRRCEVVCGPGFPSIAAELVEFENGRAQVELKRPIAGLHPGRPVAVYDADELLGGGFVDGTRKLW